MLLAALSAGASGLPGMLGGLSGLGQGKVPDFAMPGGSDENSRELRRELSDLGGTIAELKKLSQGPGADALSGLSDEELEVMKDAAPQLKFRSNALTQKLGLAPGQSSAGTGGKMAAAGRIMNRLKNRRTPQFQSFSDFRETVLRFYYGHQTAVACALWLIPSCAVALAFLLFLCKRYTLSMLLAGLLFSLATFLIWSLSASLALSALLTRQSLLAVLPRELWLSPVVFLVVSAGMLRLADENYPFWNKTVSTLLAPIAASLLAAAWPHGLIRIKGLLGAAASGKA